MVEQLDKTTYGFRMPSGDMVEVGDRLSPEFKPHLKLNRWGGECFLCPSLEQAGPTELRAEQEFVESESDLSIIRFYPIAPSEQWELGSFRMEITHKKKPKTNKVVSSILSQNVVAYYQPPLTQEEIEEGAERPDNIVGSYAFYHATKGGIVDSRGKDYKCGKVGHKPRPRIVDANGDWVWADLFVDLKTGLQVITIPEEFCEYAKYPIRHDAGADTFGYTTAGGSITSAADDRLRLRVGTPAGDGTADSISFYGLSIESAPVKGCLYLADASLVSPQGAEINPGAESDWYTSTITNGPSITAQAYWVTIWKERGRQRYDTGGVSGDSKYKIETYNGWPNPVTGLTDSALKYSIYCTYTPSVEGLSIPVAMHHYKMMRH